MNSSATIELLLRHERFARSVARHLARGGEVDDLLQEAWIAALGAPPRRAEAALAWLERTLRNVASKWRRSNSRRAAREEAVARGEHVDATDELVERLELERRVVEAVLALDEPYRSAIVLRFYEELGPSEIAEKLGVPLETVRSRLRRAHDELRRSLAADPRTARERWLSALVGIGAIRAPRVAAHAPMIASPGILGVLLMNSKLVLAIAVGVVGAALWFANSQSKAATERVAGTSTSSAKSTAERSQPMSAVHGDAGLATPDAPLVAADANGERAPIAVAANAAGELDSGHWIVRAVDAATREPIDTLEVRLANDARFASLSAKSGERYRVSFGSYTAVISASGYDATTLSALRIVSDETTETNDVVLSRGSGRIAVGVGGLDASSERTFEVELIGDGRGRCEACGASATSYDNREAAGSLDHLRWAFREADLSVATNFVTTTLNDSAPHTITSTTLEPASARCERCGFAPRSSTAELSAAHGFSFANLVAGPYSVRLLENGRVVGEPRRVELAAGASRSIVFDVSATRAIDVALVDGDGRPLTSELAASAGAKGVQLEFLRDDACFSKLWFDARPTKCAEEHAERAALELSGDDELAAGVLSANWFGVQRETTTATLAIRSKLEFLSFDALRVDRSRGASTPAPDPLIDRARAEGDELEPARPSPRFEATFASARLGDSGIAHVDSLPTANFTLRATCGSWSGEVVVPAGWSNAQIQLELRPTERPDEPELVDRLDASFGEH